MNLKHSSAEVTQLFFKDLKQYNATNFKEIANADLAVGGPNIYKAFSSVITRYFIFQEKHPELTDVELRMLYFKLKLDLIARYFSEYPDTSADNLVAFQIELRNYIKDSKGVTEDVQSAQV